MLQAYGGRKTGSIKGVNGCKLINLGAAGIVSYMRGEEGRKSEGGKHFSLGFAGVVEAAGGEW